MKKLIKYFFALTFMLGTVSIAVLLYFVKFDNQSLIGSSVKSEVIKYPALVNIVRLNEPGDNRYLYAGDVSSNLNVILASAQSTEINISATNWIDEMVKITIDKNVIVSRNNVLIPKKESYSDDDLNNIRKILDNGEDQTLYVVYLTKYAEQPGLAGITLHKDTMFIFKQSLDDLNENPEHRDRLEQSTIMHEWAHLLGVEHTKNDDCIMSEKIHVNADPRSWEGFIPVEYCSSTTRQIDNLKQK